MCMICVNTNFYKRFGEHESTDLTDLKNDAISIDVIISFY